MAQFIFTYHAGKQPETPEHGKQAMQAWKDWAAKLGAALVNPGTPVGETKVLTSKGVSDAPSSNPIDGFSIIEADNMEAALEMLKDCPHLHIFDGTLEVSEMRAMPE